MYAKRIDSAIMVSIFFRYKIRIVQSGAISLHPRQGNPLPGLTLFRFFFVFQPPDPLPQAHSLLHLFFCDLCPSLSPAANPAQKADRGFHGQATARPRERRGKDSHIGPLYPAFLSQAGMQSP